MASKQTAVITLEMTLHIFPEVCDCLWTDWLTDCFFCRHEVTGVWNYQLLLHLLQEIWEINRSPKEEGVPFHPNIKTWLLDLCNKTWGDLGCCDFHMVAQWSPLTAHLFCSCSGSWDTGQRKNKQGESILAAWGGRERGEEDALV